MKAAQVTPVTPRVISNPRARLDKILILFSFVSAGVTRYKVFKENTQRQKLTIPAVELLDLEELSIHEHIFLSPIKRNFLSYF